MVVEARRHGDSTVARLYSCCKRVAWFGRQYCKRCRPYIVGTVLQQPNESDTLFRIAYIHAANPGGLIATEMTVGPTAAVPV